ncbi:MAG: hypothetical protein EOO03_05585 [Chitinophagaceae bacterium]|nr:MAG: hypothetical protein EOO03_05585 [Chitinophagaceae bacterium]
MAIQNKRLLIITGIVLLILSVPLVAMQFTSEVNWDLQDFLIMGGLLMGTGLICEFILRMVPQLKYRIALCIVALLVLVLIWVELAVGIFGTPFAGS